MASPTPLDGLLVADLSRVLAGPLVGMTLGDLGADVVKVESPSGDDTRSWGPPFDRAGRATYHHAVNRNKRSLALDLRDAGDNELARRLCERADVVVANFRPGTLERFGLGFEQVAVANPAVVYCEISGFGEGAGRNLPGYDPLVQALGGLMSVTGPPDAPTKAGVALIDVIAGLYATTAVLAALHERARSGAGQRVTIDLLHTTLAALVNQATGWLGSDAVPRRLGNVHPSIEPFSPYRAADGELMICAGNDRQFGALAAALDVPELASDRRFATNADRVANRGALRPLLEERLAARTIAEWRPLLAAAGVPAGPINDVAQAFALAAELGLEAVDEYDGVRTVAFPARLSRTPATTRRRPPELDEDGEALRRWLAG
ncbi:MAG TPA: CoA transferase [Thermoleophilaceae bacterium]|nr:CoA transferase [Thermoleophilaceae bacterium]